MMPLIRALALSRSRALALSRSRALALSRERLALAALAGMALPAVGTSQQGPQDPPRSDYVFHIYVSPLYGDNARATALNPSTSPTGAQLMPLDRHPQPPDANNIKPITGFLNHAPYPFKTLTRSNGALAWIDANFRPGSPPFFPWTNSSTERRVTHVVVHCLPGLYGPAQIGVVPSPIDPATALPWNGEEWPAIIRDRVSIQGTSALDTIFDARGEPDGTTPPVLVVNEDRGPLESSYFTHQQSFIDSVQIRGGRVPLESTTAPVGSGAGIYVHGRRPNQQEFAISRIRITNCVFTDNIVGVGLDGYWLGDYPSMVDLGHRPMIVNNTFAWNRCGLWCGSTAVRPISDPFRNLLSYPVLINNIFDSGSPSWAITGVTGFEGVKPEDKQIRAVLSPPVLLQAAGDGVDFNAWEDSADPPNPPYVNLGNSGMFAVAAIWPRVDVSTSGSVVWFGPRVDLTPFTKSGSPRACSLYVNDIFRNSPEGGTGFEYSRYDFRLAPNVNTTTSPPGSVNPPPRNPLVNKGIEAAQPDGTMLFPITPANGEILIDEPGLPLGAEESRVDGWDWDGEGFGNPRSEARQGFATGTFGQSQEFVSHMDLGFDEMGPLIMAGYLASTRSFVKLSVAQGGVTLPDRGRIFYFNLMTGGTPPPPASYPRPLANAPFGIGEGWYQHIQAGVDLEDLNYTKLYALGPGSLRRFTAQSPPPWHFSSIPRALRCDFSPSLLLDPHSEWGRLLVYPPTYTSEDPYAANPGTTIWLESA